MGLTARCPVCGIDMRQVSARADPGRLIVLDQCGRCGGIWCDKWELFPVLPDEAKRIDSLDETLLRNPAPLPPKELYCPRCADRLQAFNDPLLPDDVRFERCRRCDGIWLNRGEFARYKEHQHKTRAANLSNEKRLERLAEAAAAPGAWMETGAQGIFAHPTRPVENDDWKTDATTGVSRLIAQTLLRLVLGL